ncbi:MAG: hypothetical protein SRB2_04171 [Desulfobacteraceae bacterium Eth-SRB2]|nr:MAG: hypothetical protein SRB2_04171 [Desulfobacteraceae bacterium Eth-SRB2]
MKSFLAYKSNGLEEHISKLAHHIEYLSLNGSTGDFSSFVESARLQKSDWLFLEEDLILNDIYGCINKLYFLDAIKRTIILMDRPQRYRELLYLRKGFPGILFKNDSFEHNYRALKKIMDGELWFRREILNALVHESLGSYPFFNHIHTTTPKLTPREIETLLFCRYYLNPDAVAKRIGVTCKSMRMYLHRLYQKLDLYSFSELNIFTRERAIDHYPLLHYKGLSGFVERPRESVALISDNMIMSNRLQRLLKKKFPHTAFYHVHRSDPNHMKKTKKIEPDLTIIDKIDNYVPTFDNIVSHLFLTTDCDEHYLLENKRVNRICLKKGWERQFFKFLKGPVYDFWFPRSLYLNFRDRALNQSHLLSLLPWAYEHWGSYFTPMEIKIFFMIKFCLPDKEIADRLNITHSAVRLHVNNLFRKTNCNTRHELLFSERFFKDRFPYFNNDILEKEPVILSKKIASVCCGRSCPSHNEPRLQTSSL